MHEVSKDELIRRIQSCLDLNYSINENFFKQTLRMMMEYLEQEEANGWIPFPKPYEQKGEEYESKRLFATTEET